MARGPTRAPSQHAYRGSVGTSRTEVVQVTAPGGDIVAAVVHVAVDAVADPELAEKLQADEPSNALNAVPLADGGRVVLGVPVVYHDPAAEVFVLVLGEGDRHRELAERGRLYGLLAADKVTVPAYVRDFAVVFGGRGLRAYLESRAEAALARARTGDGARELEREKAAVERDKAHVERDKAQLERRRAELTAREAELERGRAELDKLHREHERRAAELDVTGADLTRRLAEDDRARAELERARAELDRGRAELDRARAAAAASAPVAPVVPIAAVAAAAASAAPIAAHDDPTTHPFELSVEVHPPEAAVPPGSDPITTESHDVAPTGDPWIEGFAAGAAPSAVTLTEGETGARLALRLAGPATALARGDLDLRLQLHRTAAYPVISLTVGRPASLRGAGHVHATALLDLAVELDRKVLAALERRFALTVDLVIDGRPVRRARLDAPLSGNVPYLVRAAQDHLRTLGQEHAEISPARARKLVMAPDFDLLGLTHAEAAEWKFDKLVQLETAQQVRRALAIARRFARPSREDYLVCVRGYPVERWQQERRQVLERAVALGLWMGADLAQVAVSEGLARSRKDLVQRLDQAFEQMAIDHHLNDLDSDAADDNRKAIAEEARALGVTLGKSNGAGRAIVSDEEPVASGVIEPSLRRPAAAARAVAPAADLKGRAYDELIEMLDDRSQRVAAALELCDRGDGRAARAVVASVRRMSRAEAVRVLGASVKFGEAAAPALTAGLASSKAFLRHGCALALALLRTEAGTESVIELLLAEPTEIWRELARAVGQVGPPALMPLASRLGRLGSGAMPAHKERIAWAMAHIGVRGGKQAVETLAAGQSVVAPVARTALDLMAPAARDDLQVRGGATGGSSPGRDVTVNRAFSRRFFEALEHNLPALAAEGLEALDASGAMEMLDENDLVEEPDDVEEVGPEDEIEASELDESDLIPT